MDSSRTRVLIRPPGIRRDFGQLQTSIANISGVRNGWRCRQAVNGVINRNPSYVQKVVNVGLLTTEFARLMFTDLR